MKRARGILLRIFFLWIGFPFLVHGANLIPLGSFERLDRWGGRKDFSTIDTSVYKEGNASVKIDSKELGQKGYLYTYVKMKEGKRYKVSVWYKTKNLVPDSDRLKFTLNFNLQGGGNGSAGQKSFSFPAGDTNTDWKEYTFTVVPAPGTFQCQFILHFSDIKGLVWFDDLRVEEVEEEADNAPLTIYKTEKPPVIDARDNDACWQNAKVITGFLNADYEGNPALKQTEVRISYDDNFLYFFLRAFEPQPELLKADIKERDGSLWNNDCVEIFISPFYGTTYQFVLNPLGTLYDAEIAVDDKTMRGYVNKPEYHSSAQAQASIGKNSWSVEMAVPIASIDKEWKEGSGWTMNFTREDKVSKIDSTYSRLIGAFYQPKYFSKIEFDKDQAKIVRSVKIGSVNPLAILRTDALYKELLTDTKGNYTTYKWDNSAEKSSLPADLQGKYTDEEWGKEVDIMLDIHAKAGLMGESLPWADSRDRTRPWRSVEKCMELHRKYGTKMKCATESSAAVRIAIEKGAEIIDSSMRSHGRVSLIDPAYVEGVIEAIINCANRYKDMPYIATIEGRDEPGVSFISGKISDIGPKMKAWNQEVLKDYGFGKYGMPAPNDPSYWEKRENHPFQRIAGYRWFSDKYAESKKQMYEALKKTAPNLEYIGNDFWFMSGFTPLDYSLFARYTDWMSADPYASSAERREGRGIYNHGFGTKFLRDLSGGKPTVTVVQAFHYAGYTPKPDDLREWVSQALKTGASRIEFYVSGEKYRNPELFEEMLSLSKRITSMNRVNLPNDPDTAILCSFDSEAGEAANGDHLYTAYSILGEKIGSWFDFICDRQLERNEKELTSYKVIYLPLAKYATPGMIEPLKNYVKKGGILVIGDPEAFEYNRDGSSLSLHRKELTGVTIKGEPFVAERINIVKPGKLNGRTFPLQKTDSLYSKIHQAYTLTRSSSDVKVIAEFENKKEAVIEHTYGNGKVIYFAANPFAPDVVLINSPISELFRMIQEEAGAKIRRDIWRFLLPKE
ncbi:MAG: beta-galactosidase trimerization domain-containing protein [Candidatus Ratteibacteria bacterium]|jgi:hypothetical protein